MYIHHVTINTGHSRSSARAEVPDATIKIMQQWLADMLAGQPRAMTNEGNVSCRVVRHNSKMIEFVMSVGVAEQEDALHFVVCRHDDAKVEAWSSAGGRGGPPQIPFLAVNLLMPELEMVRRGASFDDILMLADFERCLAWAWIESLGAHKGEGATP